MGPEHVPLGTAVIPQSTRNPESAGMIAAPHYFSIVGTAVIAQSTRNPESAGIISAPHCFSIVVKIDAI